MNTDIPFWLTVATTIFSGAAILASRSAARAAVESTKEVAALNAKFSRENKGQEYRLAYAQEIAKYRIQAHKEVIQFVSNCVTKERFKEDQSLGTVLDNEEAFLHFSKEHLSLLHHTMWLTPKTFDTLRDWVSEIYLLYSDKQSGDVREVINSEEYKALMSKVIQINKLLIKDISTLDNLSAFVESLNSSDHDDPSESRPTEE